MDTYSHVGTSTEFPPSRRQIVCTRPNFAPASRFLYGRYYKYLPPTSKLKALLTQYKNPRRIGSILHYKRFQQKLSPELQLNCYNKHIKYTISLQFINDNMAKKHRHKQKKKGKASGAPKHKNSAKKSIPTDPRVENVNSGSEAADDTMSVDSKKATVIPPSAKEKSPSKRSKNLSGAANANYENLPSTPVRGSDDKPAQAGTKRDMMSTPTKSPSDRSASPSPSPHKASDLFKEGEDAGDLETKSSPALADRLNKRMASLDRAEEKYANDEEVATVDFMIDEPDKEVSEEKHENNVRIARKAKERFLERKKYENNDGSSEESGDTSSDDEEDSTNLQRNSTIDTSTDPHISSKLGKKMEKEKKDRKKKEANEPPVNVSGGKSPSTPPSTVRTNKTSTFAPQRSQTKGKSSAEPRADKAAPSKLKKSKFTPGSQSSIKNIFEGMGIKVKKKVKPPSTQTKSKSSADSSGGNKGSGGITPLTLSEFTYGSEEWMNHLPSKREGESLTLIDISIQPHKNKHKVKDNIYRVIGAAMEGGSAADQNFCAHVLAQGKIGIVTTVVKNFNESHAPKNFADLYDICEIKNDMHAQVEMPTNKNTGRKYKRGTLNLTMVIGHVVDIRDIIKRMKVMIEDRGGSVYRKALQELRTRSDMAVSGINTRMNMAGVKESLELALSNAHQHLVSQGVLSKSTLDIQLPEMNMRLNVPQDSSLIRPDSSSEDTNHRKAWSYLQDTISDKKKIFTVEYASEFLGKESTLVKIWDELRENKNFIRRILGEATTVLYVGNQRGPKKPGDKKTFTKSIAFQVLNNLETTVVEITGVSNPHQIVNISMAEYEGRETKDRHPPTEGTELLIRRLGTSSKDKCSEEAQFVQFMPDGQSMVQPHSGGDKIVLPNANIEYARPFKQASIAKILYLMPVTDNSGAAVVGGFVESMVPFITDSGSLDSSQASIKLQDPIRQQMLDNASPHFLVYIMGHCQWQRRFSKGTIQRLLACCDPSYVATMELAQYDSTGSGKVTTPFISEDDHIDTINSNRGFSFDNLPDSLAAADKAAGVDKEREMETARKMRERLNIQEGDEAKTIDSRTTKRTGATHTTGGDNKSLHDIDVGNLNTDFKRTKINHALAKGEIVGLKSEVAELKRQLEKEKKKNEKKKKKKKKSKTKRSSHSQTSGISSKESLPSVAEEDEEMSVDSSSSSESRVVKNKKSGVKFGNMDDISDLDEMDMSMNSNGVGGDEDESMASGSNSSSSSSSSGSSIPSYHKPSKHNSKPSEGFDIDQFVKTMSNAIGCYARAKKKKKIESTKELEEAVSLCSNRLQILIPSSVKVNYGNAATDEELGGPSNAVTAILDAANWKTPILGWTVSPEQWVRDYLDALSTSDNALGYQVYHKVKAAIVQGKVHNSSSLHLKLQILYYLLEEDVATNQEDADHAASECPYSITDALSWLQSATSGQDDDSEVKHGDHE